jgi:PTH2 family peptidyl-tRNA hydrolase
LEELEKLHSHCRKIKVPSMLISDAGHTQVEAGTVTVLGIGPEISEKINKITGKLRLMN